MEGEGWGSRSSGVGMHHSWATHQRAACRTQNARSLEKRARKTFERWGGGAGEGRLSKQQARLAFISLLGYKASKTELQRLCGTEGLSWEGFLRKVRERTGEEDEDEEVRQAFKVLDRSCQGFLCLSDVKDAFREAVPNIPSTVVEQVFFEMDHDRDGRLSFHCFRTMWYSSQV